MSVTIPEPEHGDDEILYRRPRWLVAILVAGAVGGMMAAVISYTTGVTSRAARREDVQHTQDLLARLKASDDFRHSETLLARRRSELLNSCAIELAIRSDPSLAAYSGVVNGDPCAELAGEPAPSPSLTTTTTTRRRPTPKKPAGTTTTTQRRSTPPATTTTTRSRCQTPMVPAGTCVTVP